MKSAAKSVMYLLAFLIVAPLAWTEKLLRAVFQRDVLFAGQAELLSLVPGKTGSYLRNAYYFLTLDSCPLHCRFLLGSMVTHSEARIGQRVYVGTHCILGMVDIGDDTMLADHVYVLSGSSQHGIQDPDVPFQQQPGTFTKVTIGKNVWIGTNTVVMANIGEDCIVGAASNVTKEVPAGHVAAGNPARIIRKTFADDKAAKTSLGTA